MKREMALGAERGSEAAAVGDEKRRRAIVERKEQEKKERFQFPLRFDPFRFLLAVLEKLPRICGVALGVGVLLALFAFVRYRDMYALPFELLARAEGVVGKREGIGEPYRPRALSDDALLRLTTSNEVFEMASGLMAPPMGAEDFQESVDAEKVRGTEVFELTAVSARGPEHAVALARAWTQGILRHSAGIQKEEAEEEVRFLKMQQEINRKGLDELNERLLAFSEKEEFFDEEKQLESYYEQINDLRKRAEEAQIELESKSAQIAVYTREIKGPFQIRQIITAKQAELQKLKEENGYTDAHPTVLGLVAELQAMEKQLEASAQAPDPGGDIKDYTDGLVNMQLYNNILRLEEERKLLENKLAQYRELIGKKQAEIGELPEKVIEIADLKSKWEEGLAKSAAIEGRMKEAEFFVENAPSHFKRFGEPVVSSVEFSPALTKIILFGILGCFLGGVGALCHVGYRELREKRLRTHLQASIVYGAPPIFRYFHGQDAGAPSFLGLRKFWIGRIAKRFPGRRASLFLPVGELRGEKDFWETLLAQANSEGWQVFLLDFHRQPLQFEVNGTRVMPFDPGKPAKVSSINPYDYPIEDIRKLVQEELPDHALVFGRWDAEPSTSLLEVARAFHQSYVLVSAVDTDLHLFEERSTVLHGILDDLEGFVMVEEEKPGMARRTVEFMEDWFIDTRRRKEEIRRSERDLSLAPAS